MEIERFDSSLDESKRGCISRADAPLKREVVAGESIRRVRGWDENGRGTRERGGGESGRSALAVNEKMQRSSDAALPGDYRRRETYGRADGWTRVDGRTV